MTTSESNAVRLVIFLSEDDRVGQTSAALALLERAKSEGLAGATLWRGIEGFGRHGHLRAERLPDLARGLPLLVEIIDDSEPIRRFLAAIRDLALDVLVTTEPVHVVHP